MKKQAEKTAQTRAKLINAFWELYKSKSITKITIREVTDKAGVYRSTFYLHFLDVYDLLEQLENDTLQYWNDKVAQNVKNNTFDELVDAISLFYEGKGEYISVLLGPSGDPMFIQKIKETISPLAREMFMFSPDDQEFEFVFEFYITGMLAILTHWYQFRKNIPAKEVVALAQSLIANKVAPILRIK